LRSTATGLLNGVSRPAAAEKGPAIGSGAEIRLAEQKTTDISYFDIKQENKSGTLRAARSAQPPGLDPRALISRGFDGDLFLRGQPEFSI